MTQVPELAAHTTSVDGLKKLLGKGFLAPNAKKQFKKLSQASESGVAVAHTLLHMHTDSDGGGDYEVKVFSTGGPISDEQLTALKQQAKEVEARGTLRAAAYLYAGLEPWDGGAKGWWREYQEFRREMSSPEQGIYVYPLSLLAGDGASPYVMWARIDGELQIAALYEKHTGA